MVRPTPGLNRTAPLTRRSAVRPHDVGRLIDKRDGNLSMQGQNLQTVVSRVRKGARPLSLLLLPASFFERFLEAALPPSSVGVGQHRLASVVSAAAGTNEAGLLAFLFQGVRFPRAQVHPARHQVSCWGMSFSPSVARGGGGFERGWCGAGPLFRRRRSWGLGIAVRRGGGLRAVAGSRTW